MSGMTVSPDQGRPREAAAALFRLNQKAAQTMCSLLIPLHLHPALFFTEDSLCAATGFYRKPRHVPHASTS
jgi:hypothetical protein